MPTPRSSVADRRRRFHALHRSGCFVIPNPWDAGSARYLQSLGFQALATTSAGFAWSHARPDNGITRDMALAHLHEMVAAVDVLLMLGTPGIAALPCCWRACSLGDSGAVGVGQAGVGRKGWALQERVSRRGRRDSQRPSNCPRGLRRKHGDAGGSGAVQSVLCVAGAIQPASREFDANVDC